MRCIIFSSINAKGQFVNVIYSVLFCIYERDPCAFFLRVASKVITEYHFLKLWKPIFWVSGPHQRTD